MSKASLPEEPTSLGLGARRRGCRRRTRLVADRVAPRRVFNEPTPPRNPPLFALSVLTLFPLFPSLSAAAAAADDIAVAVAVAIVVDTPACRFGGVGVGVYRWRDGTTYRRFSNSESPTPSKSAFSCIRFIPNLASMNYKFETNF
uniref:Uncharacterized protein n=1 Tax=Ananas comosus var. bracteatus TaxID=296719 RepID=A0A6V7PFN5_ANACO|nr:unnamed protein product [Ananas comosus var. bracteatus]